jgi:glutamate N-acetyltransferase/amino-acid N-acetyltransferase
MAIGKAPIEDVDTSLIELRLDDLLVAKAGMLSESYAEAEGAKVLGQKEFSVKINLGRGDASTEIWTTDLSYDYVKINAEYRT